MIVYLRIVLNFVVERTKDSRYGFLLLNIGRHRNSNLLHYRPRHLLECSSTPHIFYAVAVMNQEIVEEHIICVQIRHDAFESLICADLILRNRNIPYRSAGCK